MCTSIVVVYMYALPSGCVAPVFLYPATFSVFMLCIPMAGDWLRLLRHICTVDDNKISHP